MSESEEGLVCRLDSFIGCANVDTGSDLDLVSPKFVKQRGLNVRGGVEILEFADGSTGRTSGNVEARFEIGKVDYLGFTLREIPIPDREFFVLDNLTSDILVGQDTLEHLDVISHNSDLLIDSIPQPGLSDCNIIRHIGSAERAVKSALKTIKEGFAGK